MRGFHLPPPSPILCRMHVIVQPRDGIEPLLKGIREAQHTIEVTIFRLDRLEIEQALVEAAWRGVHVHALITYTNKEDLKEIKKVVDKIKKVEPAIAELSDDELRAKTQEFKERFKNGESLNKLLPEAFAVLNSTIISFAAQETFQPNCCIVA